MKKVVLMMHVSLDGFACGPNGEMDWVTLDDEIFKDVIALQYTADTALLGGNLYKEMAGYWPTIPSNPQSSPNDIEHANWINEVSKIVFSDTLTQPEWNNTTVVKEISSKTLEEIKGKANKDLILFGGVMAAQEFINQGLVDEFHLNVNPVILGKGRSFFSDVTLRTSLKLLESKAYASGVVHMHYQKQPK